MRSTRWLHGWTVAALAAVLAVSAPSCGSNGLFLDLVVITDFLPGLELATIRIDIDGREPGDAESYFSTRVSFVPGLDDNFIRGVSVAHVNLPQHGHYTATLQLLDRSGRMLAHSELDAFIVDSLTSTISITRNCVGVVCPGIGDAPEDTACLGGRCVTPACAMDPTHCTDLPCTSDSQCSSPVACGAGECVRGGCLVAPRPVGTPGACALGRICDPVAGCRDAPAGSCESGTDGACTLQEGVCAGAIVHCASGFFPDCSSREYGVRFQPQESLCDGLDNDCNGMTDEMDAPLCPLQMGVCAGAARVCAGRDGYLACDYATHDFAYEPVEQTCDGLDNDCDGHVDESVANVPCPLRDGVCIGSHATCRTGSLACNAADYPASYESSELSCDGLDNDCDRAVDEALMPPNCSLSLGVCAGSVARCRGASGWSTCGAAEYGTTWEPSETRCDGVDNDCDGIVDEGITRACNVGCGAGTETCSNGIYVGCNAPVRTELRSVSLAGGAYTWSCLDIPSGASVDFGDGTTINTTGDVAVLGTLAFLGRGAAVHATGLRVGPSGHLVAGELTVDVTGVIRIDEGGLIDGTGLYSGGGGGACSALGTRGVSGGGGGGAAGGSGGRGGGCDTAAGLLGGVGVGGGANGFAGCDCACSTPTPGAAPSGGGAGSGCAGSGGGAGAGGNGGVGGAGAFPNTGWAGAGGGGGVAPGSSGPPSFGGGGGGGGGAELGYFGAGCAWHGGGGGGHFVLRAAHVIDSGRIALDGADGTGVGGWVRTGCSGGGGAGALVVEASLFDNVGIVTAAGGRGGSVSQQAANQSCVDTSSGGGGGGGGGYVYLDVDALGSGSLARISVGGGSGGAIECSTPPGASGVSGVRCCARSISGCPLCP